MARKLIIYTIVAVVLSIMPGCKQKEWVDWKTLNTVWLENNIKTDATGLLKVTSSGLQYRILADPTPTDARPHSGSYVICDYELRLINGVVVQKGTQTGMSMANVVSGFAEGLHLIHNNGDIELFIPYNLGYGEDSRGTEGTSGYIPPYSTLIFKIHLSMVSGD